MREITLEELLEAGCHFGHVVTRQNPKARDFVFEARDNIHIIDLAKTKEGLEAAGAFVKDLASRKDSTFCIVGTKRQAREAILSALEKAIAEGAQEGLFSVINRWIGGTLTNFSEVAKNYKKLKDLAVRLKDDEEKARFTKKEVGLWEKERQKLESLYGGVSNMKNIPDALFIIDSHLEDLAVREAKNRGVSIVGIVDTNADPTFIDYPIPANDDAVGSIKLIVEYIMEAWIEGRKLKVESEPARNASTSDADGKLEVEGETKEIEVKIKKEVKGGKRKPKATKKAA